MGETYITMKVHGPNGSEELDEVLVDTGATSDDEFTCQAERGN